ncbi:hypothetical protein HDV02_002833 [Globomyces sp. JEL0801]|nr:hypothetical protein HDV02_002833 [Globomyces sp. JEL0801]
MELEKYALFLYTFNGRAFVQLIVALIGFSVNAAFFPILFLLMAIIFGLFGHYHIIEFPRYKCIAIKAEVEPLNSVVVERENDLPNYEVVGSVPDEKEGPSTIY